MARWSVVASPALSAVLPVQQEGYELMETQDGTGAVVIVDFLINNGAAEPSVCHLCHASDNVTISLSLSRTARNDFF